MSMYHLHCSNISRSSGRSCVASASYISASKITNEYDGVTHDFTKKQNVAYSEIMLPSNAPEEYKDRSTLWNAVEQSEKQSSARTARQIEVAFPNELSMEESKTLIQKYTKENFVDKGMCADINIHWKPGNHHAHVQLTVRPLDDKGNWQSKCEKLYLCKNHQGEEKGLTASELKGLKDEGWEKQLPYYNDGKKNGKMIYLTKYQKDHDPQYADYERVSGKNNPKRNRDNRMNPIIEKWNSADSLEQWRADWAKKCNERLKEKGAELIDHRSYERQGKEQLPTIHLGSSAAQMERRGIRTERGDINRRIARANEELKILSMAYHISYQERAELIASNQEPQIPKVTIQGNTRKQKQFDKMIHENEDNRSNRQNKDVNSEKGINPSLTDKKDDISQISTSNINLDSLQKDVETRKAEMDSKERDWKELDHKYLIARSNYSNEIQNKTSHITQNADRIEALQEELQRLNKKLFKSKKEISGIQEELDSLKIENRKLELDVNALKDKYEPYLNKLHVHIIDAKREHVQAFRNYKSALDKVTELETMQKVHENAEQHHTIQIEQHRKLHRTKQR